MGILEDILKELQEINKKLTGPSTQQELMSWSADAAERIEVNVEDRKAVEVECLQQEVTEAVTNIIDQVQGKADATESNITLEELREASMRLKDKKGAAAVKALLDEMNVEKLSAVPEEKYSHFIQRIEEELS